MHKQSCVHLGRRNTCKVMEATSLSGASVPVLGGRRSRTGRQQTTALLLCAAGGTRRVKGLVGQRDAQGVQQRRVGKVGRPGNRLEGKSMQGCRSTSYLRRYGGMPRSLFERYCT